MKKVHVWESITYLWDCSICGHLNEEIDEHDVGDEMVCHKMSCCETFIYTDDLWKMEKNLRRMMNMKNKVIIKSSKEHFERKTQLEEEGTCPECGHFSWNNFVFPYNGGKYCRCEKCYCEWKKDDDMDWKALLVAIFVTTLIVLLTYLI